MAYMESYEQLAFAIVKLAVEDYRSALKRLKRHSKDQKALWSKADCERFFRNDIGTYCNLDGEKIMKAIQEQVGYNDG